MPQNGYAADTGNATIQSNQAAASRLLLTPEELAWLTQHKEIRFGVDPGWPPFDFVDSRGRHQGISADVLRLIGLKLGISLNRVPDLTWPQVVSGIKNRVLDIASICAKTPERSKFMSYSEPITTSHWVVVTQSDARPIRNLDDLAGERVSMSKGYAVVELVRQKYPDILINESVSPEDGLKTVATGKTAAYIGYLSSVTYLIQKYNFANLKIASDAGFDAVPLHICMRSDAPELVSIINKGIQSISKEEMDAIQRKWSPLQLDGVAREFFRPGAIIGLSIITLIVFAGLVILMVRVSRKESLSRKFGSVRFRSGVIIVQALIVVALIVLAWSILENNRHQLSRDRQAEIETVLKTTAERLHIWENTQKLILQQIADNDELIAITQQLLSVAPTAEALKDSTALEQARKYFRNNLERFGNIGFFIISPDRISIGSSRDSNLGMVNLIQQQRPDLLEMAFQGESVFITPIRSDVPLGANTTGNPVIEPTMFFATPIHNLQGEVIAVLTKRLDPARSFSKVMQFGEFGQTGETYAFDGNGRLFSESRFNQQLIQTGLLKAGHHSSFTVQVRDPGGNLLEGFRPSIPTDQQALTRMAASAVRGESGVDMAGYRDYRGVSVVGAWLWDNRLNIGLTAEIDKEEAFSAYYVMRLTMLGMLGLMLVISVGGTTYTLFLGEKASLALRRSRDELEAQVYERTIELNQEIEERKQSESKLAGSESRLNFMLSSSPVVIYTCTVTPPFGATYVSPNVRQHLGFNPEQFVEDSGFWVENIHADDRDRILDGLTKLFERGTHKHEYRFRVGDGSYRWMLDELTLVRDEIGEPVEIIGYWVDITDSKMMQKRMEQQKQLLDMLHRSTTSFVEKGDFSETMHDMLDTLLELTVSEYGFMGEVLYDDADNPYLKTYAITNIAWNPETQALYDENATKGLEFHNLDTLFGQALTSRETVVSNNPASDPRAGGLPLGHPAMHSFLGVPVFYGNELVGMYGIANRANGYDEEIQQFLRPFDATYGVMIHSRHMMEQDEVNRKALVEAKDSAESANRAKSDFLSSMSHELRTPLNAILGLSQLFEYDRNLTEEQKTNAREIAKAGEHLLTLINEVLDLARIESGHVELSMQAISLARILEECRVLIAPVAESLNISLDVNSSQCDQHYVKADYTRIKQVLLNLMSNAVKYNRKGGSVSVHCTIENAGSLRVSIKDTGQGISADKLSDLFQPFNRLGAEQGDMEGTGIGLVITRQLVELMGGTIGVNSVYGEGSTFWVELHLTSPVESGHEVADVNRISSAVDLPEAFTTQAHILIAEDNPANQAVLKLQMRLLGLRADFTENGVIAWEHWVNGHYDLLLTDINMPLMDGYELVEKIRDAEKQTGEHRPVIAITANAMAKDVKRCLESGMDAFVSKPVLLKELQAALKQWLPQQVSIKAATANSQNDAVVEEEADSNTEKPAMPNERGRLKISEFRQQPEQTIQQHAFALLRDIDVPLGLSNVEQNAGLYHKLLLQFIENSSKFVDNFLAAQKRRDTETMIRLPHTLKSAAAIIAAKQVQQAASDLEQACDSGQAEQEINRLLGALNTAMIPPIESITEYRKKTALADTEDDSAIDTEQMAPKIHQLAQLLKDNDTRAIAVMDQIMQQPCNASQRLLLTEIMDRINQIEFDSALALLHRFADTLQINIGVNKE